MTNQAQQVVQVMADFQAEMERIKKAVEAATERAADKLQNIISKNEHDNQRGEKERR